MIILLHLDKQKDLKYSLKELLGITQIAREILEINLLILIRHKILLSPLIWEDQLNESDIIQVNLNFK